MYLICIVLPIVTDFGVADQVKISLALWKAFSHVTAKLIHEKYDRKFLLEPTGGMFHIKPDEAAYRKNRCLEIYGEIVD